MRSNDPAAERGARRHARGGPEQPLAESAAATRAHVQLDELAVVRRAGDGEAAAAAALEQHVQVLPGLEAQALHRRQPQPHLHHVGGERRAGAQSGTAAS